MNRNQSVSMVELIMSAGILFLIVLVGWRLVQEVSHPEIKLPSAIRSADKSPSRLAQPLVQLAPEEYERIINLEREVATLSIGQSMQVKQSEKLIDLEKEMAALSLLRSLPGENKERLASLDKELAAFSAKQDIQLSRTERIGELEKRVTDISAGRIVQNEHTNRLSDMGRRIALVEKVLSQVSVGQNHAVPNSSTLAGPSSSSSKGDWLRELSRYNEDQSGQRRARQGKAPLVKKGYFIPSGCFLYVIHADNLESSLSNWQLPYYRKEVQSGGRTFTCVFVGPIAEWDQAKKTLRSLQENNITEAFQVVRYRSR